MRVDSVGAKHRHPHNHARRALENVLFTFFSGSSALITGEHDALFPDDESASSRRGNLECCSKETKNTLALRISAKKGETSTWREDQRGDRCHLCVNRVLLARAFLLAFFN